MEQNSINMLSNSFTRNWLFVASLYIAAFAGTAYGQTLTGVVFEDLNENQLHDSGEQGISNVRVSNGLDVVLTDDGGKYEINVDGDSIVFITKPRGYATPVNNANIPQFYYVHRPTGSPTHFRYPGVSPTGALPEEWNFPLVKESVETEFDAILFADPQPQTEVELDFIRDDVITELIGSSARFGMTMGDIMFDDLSLFSRYNQLISTIAIPWYNVPGNHELNFEAESDATSLETFTRHFGPPYYSFEVGNVVFFVLDNVVYGGRTEPTAENLTGRGSYRGAIDEVQLNWFKEELKHVPTSKLIFIAVHVPLNSPAGDAPGIHTQNGGELLKLLDNYPNVYSVAGHMHAGQHVYLNSDNEVDLEGRFHHHVLSTVSGSWWSGPFDERGIPVAVQSDGVPNGYHILKIKDVTPSVEFKGAGEPADYQMRITLDASFHSNNANGLRDYRVGELFDGKITVEQVASTRVLVNVFDGGPKSHVEFRVGESQVQVMDKILEPDPHFVELVNQFQDTMKSWLQPYPSQHLWAAKLPSLEPGIHVLNVKAINDEGREHFGSKVLEITSN